MKKLRGKKLLSVILSLSIALSMWSVPVLAENQGDVVLAESGGITVTKIGDSGDVTYTEGEGFLFRSGDYKVSGTWTGNLTAASDLSQSRSVFTVEQGQTVNITLDAIAIDTGDKINACAFRVLGAANITLTGNNTLKSGAGHAGLEVAEGASVTIHDPGILTTLRCRRVLH